MNKRILPWSVLGIGMMVLVLTTLACGGKAEEVRQRAAQQLDVAAEKLGGNQSSQQEKDVKPTTDPKPNANQPGKTPEGKSELAPMASTLVANLGKIPKNPMVKTPTTLPKHLANPKVSSKSLKKRF